jgi:hypothetical protein
MPRLIASTGAVAVLEVDGTEVYRDQETLSAIARIAGLQAGHSAAHLAGLVLDADGRPVPGAMVTTESPARAAMTNGSGAFEIRTLPTNELIVRVTKEGYASGLVRVVPTKDADLQITITLSRKSAPEGLGAVGRVDSARPPPSTTWLMELPVARPWIHFMQ